MNRCSQVGLEFMISIFFVMSITAIVIGFIGSNYDAETYNNYLMLRDNCLSFSNSVANCLKLGSGTTKFMNRNNLSIDGDNNLVMSIGDDAIAFCNLPTKNIFFDSSSYFNLTNGEYVVRCNSGKVEVLAR